MSVHIYTNGAWRDSGRIYRNSLNLFNKENPSMKYYGYIDNVTYVVMESTYDSLSIIVPVKSNTDYTISKLSTSRFRVALFNNYPVTGSRATAIYGDRDGDGIDYGTTLSFSTSANTTYIMAFVRNYNDTVTESEILNSIMVNEGGALPYEPYNVVDWYANHGHGYSSGAWS